MCSSDLAARALSKDESHDARRAVVDALEVLEGNLLAHLEYEELNIASTARRLRDLPSSVTTKSEERR